MTDDVTDVEQARNEAVTTLLQVEAVSKRYDATQALDCVDFDVRAGEIHALLGENGAGKSTLVRIMSGAVQPDEGVLRWSGDETSLNSPGVALKVGIAVVHQELALMPHLTVAENLYLNMIPTAGGRIGEAVGIVSRRRLYSRAAEFLRSIDFELDPRSLVGSLNQSQRQLVEIARALAQQARLILLDEPTSSLPPHERQDLANRLRSLRDHGIGIVLVTHLLGEAHELADRITVLRDGRRVGTVSSDEIDIQKLIELMTGRSEGSIFPEHDGRRSDERVPRLELRHLASYPSVKDVSFAVFAGEIVGLAGLVGAGRTGVLETIFGRRTRADGDILVDGRPVNYRSPLTAIEAGVAFIPEDRQTDGLFPEQSIRANVVIAAAQAKRGAKVTRLGRLVVSPRLARQVAAKLITALQIRTPSSELAARTLSGGNQQKVVLARWLAMEPSIVLADDPTRGVSIGSKIEIYQLLRDLARRGAAIVVVSSEFEELVGMCDRVIIVDQGANVAKLDLTRTTDFGADDLLHLVLSSTTVQAEAS